MNQRVVYGAVGQALEGELKALGIRRALLVCGRSLARLPFCGDVTSSGRVAAVFSGFEPNPEWDGALAGAEAFRRASCDGVLAVGGGSAMDVGKCVKLFAALPIGAGFPPPPYAPSDIPLLAVPTTAGTGSESTRYAVIYTHGVKQSVHSDSILPDTALLDASSLAALPLYQKKCTLLDALCQAVESAWSVRATAESRELAYAAIRTILLWMDRYLSGDPAAFESMMRGANLAGQAINITQTTAPHAMSYQLSKTYGIPHGHAVALSLPGVWLYLLDNAEKCVDPRGEDALRGALDAIAGAMGQPDARAGALFFAELLQKMDIARPPITDEQAAKLTQSVNPLRLQNSPVPLPPEALYRLYKG